MKRLFTYLFPVIAVALTTGCFNTKGGDPAPEVAGTFTGQFRRVHRAAGQTAIDTVKANLKITITPGVGYEVLGDTATVHAGSKGHYGINNASGIAFVDNTNLNAIPAKTHLNGEYAYFYDGSTFQMVRNSGDTLSLQYDLKKSN
jgi:hypothetical protein